MSCCKSRCVCWRSSTFAKHIQITLVLLAGFLLKVSTGLVNTFGNMVHYYVSYIRCRSHPEELRSVDAPIVFACQVICVGLGVIVGGVLETHFGPRVTSFIGTVLMTLGLISTYFTIKISFWLTVLSYGVLFAFGSGLPSVCAVLCAAKWLPKWDQVISWIFLAASGIGTAMFALLQTSYINPHNYAPDRAPFLGNPDEKYFTHDELLVRVPQAFLLLGVITCSLQLVGSVFLSVPHKEEPEKATDSGETQRLMESVDSRRIHDSDPNKFAPDKGVRGAKRNRLCIKSSATSSDSTPWEMIKSRKFYILWAMRVTSWIALIYFQSLYKVFALEEVTNNDIFLSVVRAFGAMAHIASLLLWDYLSDTVDYKFSFIMQSGLLTYVLLTFYATILGGEVMLFFWYSLCSFGGSIYPRAVSELFGKKHLGSNITLLLVMSVPFVILSAFLPGYLIDHIHWYGLFFVLGGASLLQFCLAFMLSFS